METSAANRFVEEDPESFTIVFKVSRNVVPLLQDSNDDTMLKKLLELLLSKHALLLEEVFKEPDNRSVDFPMIVKVTSTIGMVAATRTVFLRCFCT